MGETSVYYVPNDESRFIGKENEVAEAFWILGIFIVTEDRFIYKRIKEWKSKGLPLPEWGHSFTFAEMGIGGSPLGEPVPNLIYDLICPHCENDISDSAHDVWEDEDSQIPLSDRLVTCPSCNRSIITTDLKSIETAFTVSKFFLWVADIDEANWDPSFKKTVESVLGPCNEYQAWET